jgi:hypothetical protein
MRIHWVVFLICATVHAADPVLTLYNQNFAAVRESVDLGLKPGANAIQFTEITSYLEPESVILRDPAGKQTLRILEQSYRSDVVSLEWLLRMHEGKTIEFAVRSGERVEIVPARIVRAGIMQHPYQPGPYGPVYRPQLPLQQPVIEMNGKLRFDLPGTPLFPGLAGDSILKPLLNWVIEAGAGGKLTAELSYLSGGFNWEADYSVIQRTGDALDIVALVTMENNSGRSFENARVKLMAGDVNKVRPVPGVVGGIPGGVGGGVIGGVVPPPPVAEKTFDEYHLYTLERPVTLRDREIKQVEFIRAEGAGSKMLYVYDGAKIDWNRFRGMPLEALRGDSSFGTQSNSKVSVMREFVNSKANRLGMPLPKGRVRFYRPDTDGRLEFTGEDTIDHTPQDETIRIFTGAAFDLVGERRRTSYRIDHGRSTLDQTFEITVRNRKADAVNVLVVEHMYRWSTWEIPVSSIAFKKRDAQTVEFDVALAPGEEKVLSYAVRYTW